MKKIFTKVICLIVFVLILTSLAVTPAFAAVDLEELYPLVKKAHWLTCISAFSVTRFVRAW